LITNDRLSIIKLKNLGAYYMKKIIRLSCILKWVALTTCVALPFIEFGYWMTNGYQSVAKIFEPFFKVKQLPSFGICQITWDNLNFLQKFLGFSSNMLQIIFYMLFLFRISELFKAFEKLRFFKSKNVRTLKKASWALVFSQIIYPFHIATLSLALTYNNPVGERVLSTGVGSYQIGILVIGLSILLAGWIFDEAVKLHQEQEATI
jgi:Protein of unknown function (DUF2975)